MKMNVALCLATVFLLGAGEADGEKKEVEKLKGTWSISELTYNAKDHGNLKFNFTFKGNELVVEGNDRIKVEYARIKVKLDPSTMPKLFDMTVSAGSQEGSVMEGIYELKGDELRICSKVFGKDRPSEFSSPDGASTVLMVLKRVP